MEFITQSQNFSYIKKPERFPIVQCNFTDPHVALRLVIHYTLRKHALTKQKLFGMSIFLNANY